MFHLKGPLQRGKKPEVAYRYLLIITYTPALSNAQPTPAQPQVQAGNVTVVQSEKIAATSTDRAKKLSESAISPPFNKARMNWRRFEGSAIKVLLSGHPIQGTIIGLMSDFKKLTGITVKMMQAAGSPKWSEYNWYEVAAEFQAGKYLAIMDANPFATILEAQGSPIRGKGGYLPTPPGPKGRQSFLWVWGLGINSFSNHKRAGWLFIQWITSQHMLRQAIKYGNRKTPRRSVWFDSEVAAFLRTIDDGRWYENSTKLGTRLAAMRWSPNPLAPMVGNLWAGAIQDAWHGKYTVKRALDKAAAEVDALMKQAGYGQ